LVEAIFAHFLCIFLFSPYDPEQDYIMQRVNMFLGGSA
jgi:hypothetical protein